MKLAIDWIQRYVTLGLGRLSELGEVFFGANSYSPKPREFWTTSSGASGSRSPLAFLRALS